MSKRKKRESPELKEAKKLVRKKYPYACAVEGTMTETWCLKKHPDDYNPLARHQRDEEAAWLAAASVIQGTAPYGVG